MKKIKGLAEKLWLRFVKAEIPTRAAALAYHSLLAIVPIVGLCFWYLTRLGVTEQWRDLSRRFILQQLNVSSSKIFLEHFNHLTSIAGSHVGSHR